MSAPNDNPPNDTGKTTNAGEQGGAQAQTGALKPDTNKAPAEELKTFTQADLEAAEARGRKAAEADAKKKEDAGKLSAEEREKRRADEAEAKLRERDARDQLQDAAKEAGANNPAKVYRLVKDDLEFDDKGKPTNLKEVLARARRDFPDEFGAKRPPGSADGGAGRGGGGAKRSMNDLIRGRR